MMLKHRIYSSLFPGFPPCRRGFAACFATGDTEHLRTTTDRYYPAVYFKEAPVPLMSPVFGFAQPEVVPKPEKNRISRIAGEIRAVGLSSRRTFERRNTRKPGDSLTTYNFMAATGDSYLVVTRLRIFRKIFSDKNCN